MEARIDHALERAFKSIIEEPGFIAIWLPVFVANAVILSFCLEHILSSLSISYEYSSFETFKTSAEEFLRNNIWKLLTITGAYMFSSIILGLSATAGTVLKAHAMEKGEYLEAFKSLKKGLSYVPTLLGASILWSLIILGPFLLIILLGVTISPFFLIGLLIWTIIAIYLGIRLLLFIPTSVLEDLGPVKALSRSWETSKCNFWSIFAVIFILMIISSVISTIPNFFGTGTISYIGSMLISVILAPIYHVGLTVLYLVLSEKNPGI